MTTPTLSMRIFGQIQRELGIRADGMWGKTTVSFELRYKLNKKGLAAFKKDQDNAKRTGKSADRK